MFVVMHLNYAITAVYSLFHDIFLTIVQAKYKGTAREEKKKDIHLQMGHSMARPTRETVFCAIDGTERSEVFVGRCYSSETKLCASKLIESL